MDQEAAIPIALVLLSSYSIAAWVSRSRKGTVESYLFAGNTPVYALSSCLGAMFSLTAAFTALLASGYVFGSQVILSMAPGAACGVLVLLRISRQPHVIHFLSHDREREFRGGVSYLGLLDHTFRGQSYLLYYVLAIAVYTSFIATEFAVFRITLAALAPDLAPPELMLTLVMTLLICYSYVYIGGFRAALVTDHFQMGIIVIFLGALAAMFDSSRLLGSLPPMSSAKALSGSPLELLLLHLGCFIGGFAVVLVSLDQWYRTLATLPLRTGRQVLVLGVLLICALSLIPLLVGSYAQTIAGFPANVTNYISTLLLKSLLRHSNRTTRFLFFMTLAAVVLTTLDTYMLTVQQLYYEFAARLRATTSRTYLVEYALKWRQVRLVGFLIACLGFLCSLLVDVHDVYVVGVGALALAILLAPLLLIQLVPPTRRLSGWYPPLSLLGSAILCPVVARQLESFVGPLDVHLYLVAVAAGSATLLTHCILLLISGFTHD